MNIRFVSRNKHKIREVKEILEDGDIIITPVNIAIDEIQSINERDILRDKVLKAFHKVGNPVFVEHTGLYIDSLNEFPGGLTQVFWDTLKADNFAHVVNQLDSPKLKAKTTICYCDGRNLEYFEGEIAGSVPKTPRGSREFQWDCVFIPDGHSETFAEMGEKKNKLSMRFQALMKFKNFLNERNRS